MSSNSSNSRRDQPPAYKPPTYAPQYVEYADEPRKYQSRASLIKQSFTASRSNSIDSRASKATEGSDASSTHSKSGLLSKLKVKSPDGKEPSKKTETRKTKEGTKQRSYEAASNFMALR